MYKRQIIGVEARVAFHRTSEGSVESRPLHQGGEQKATRIREDHWKPTLADLEVYTGRFFSEELETFYQVATKDSSLVIHHRRVAEPWKFSPAKEDTFAGTFPISELVFHRNDAGEVVGLEVSNARTRGVQFKRWK